MTLIIKVVMELIYIVHIHLLQSVPSARFEVNLISSIQWSYRINRYISKLTGPHKNWQGHEQKESLIHKTIPEASSRTSFTSNRGELNIGKRPEIQLGSRLSIKITTESNNDCFYVNTKFKLKNSNPSFICIIPFNSIWGEWHCSQ